MKTSVRTFLFNHRWFWLIILLAFVLRLGRLDLMQWDFDDGNALILAYQLVHAGKFHLVGLMTSLDIRNPPFFIWLISLPMLISSDPVFTAAFIALLSGISVALTYFIGCRYYNQRVGLLAALTMAISPCLIFYSRRIFAQDVMPLLSTIALLCFLEYYHREKAWALCLALLVAMLSVGVHFSGFALCLSLAAAWLLLRPKLNWQPVVVALALAILAYSPYLVHQFRTGFFDVKRIAQTIVSGDEKEAFEKHKIIYYSFYLVSHGNMAFILGDEPYNENNKYETPYSNFRRRLPGYRSLATFAGLGILATALCGLWFSFRRGNEENEQAKDTREKWRKVLPLTAWLFIPPIVYASMKLYVIPSYLLVIYPAPFLLLAFGFDQLLFRPQAQVENQDQEEGESRGLFSGMMFGLIGLYCAHQLAFIIAFLVILIKPGVKADYPYVPYRDQLQAVELMHELSEGRSWSVRMNLSDEGEIPFNYFYLSYLIGGAKSNFNSLERKSEQPDFKFIIFDIPVFRTSAFVGAIIELEGAAHYPNGAVHVAEFSQADPEKVQEFETTWKTNPTLVDIGK